MMKLLRRLAGLMAVLTLLMAFAMPKAMGQEYTYKVRIYAGKQGTLVSSGDNGGWIADDGSMLVCEGRAYGDQIVFRNNMVSLNDGSKYYVKGIRQSGKGTEEVSETGNSARTAAFKVTKDQDFVVAYGVLTDPVEYTINYHSASGQELAPSETYYGNVGDRPVIAYQYIEGYQPQAYNLTKTLTDDPAENVFTFIYSPLPDNTVYTNTTTTTVVPGTTPGGTSSTGGESSAPEDAATPQPEDDIPDNDVPAAPPEDDEGQDENSEPQDIINIDENEVPLGDYDDLGLDRNEASLTSEGQLFWNHIPLAAKIVGGVVMLGGFSVAMWLLIFRRRRKDEE